MTSGANVSISLVATAQSPRSCAGVHVIQRLNISDVRCFRTPTWSGSGSLLPWRCGERIEGKKAGEEPIRRRTAGLPRPPAIHASDLRSEQRIYQSSERRQIKGVCSDPNRSADIRAHKPDFLSHSLLLLGNNTRKPVIQVKH